MRRKRPPNPPPPISKGDIELGLILGHVLIEIKDLLNPLQKHWVEELLEEGRAVATEWKDHPDLGKKYRIISRHPLPEGAVVKAFNVQPRRDEGAGEVS